jgi:AcrR family transcriptional regulator
MGAGGQGFAIEEVARHSGVAKTTIHRHFPTPNGLLVAALDGATPSSGTPDNGSLREDPLEFLESTVERILSLLKGSSVEAPTRCCPTFRRDGLQGWVRDSVLPSGSANQATSAPPEVAQTPNSS